KCLQVRQIFWPPSLWSHHLMTKKGATRFGQRTDQPPADTKDSAICDRKIRDFRTTTLQGFRRLHKFLTSGPYSTECAISFTCAKPPLFSPPRRGRCKRGSFDSLMAAALPR